MRIKGLIMCAVTSLLVTGQLGAVSAQQLTINVNAGISQPVESDSDMWKTGFVMGASGFIWVSDKVGIGGRFGYNRKAADKGSLTEFVEAITGTDITASETILEFIPSARIRTRYTISPVNFFGQGGFGLYATQRKAEIKGVDQDSQIDLVLDDEGWISRTGVQFGAGISLGAFPFFSIDIFPLYNIVFASKDNSYDYWTGNIGISFQI